MIAGQAVEVVIEPRGSSLAAAAAAAATSILVEDPTPFDDEGGLVLIDGLVYEYADVVEVASVDDDSVNNATISITPALPVALEESEPVQLWSGNQVLDDVRVMVETGDDEPTPVTLLAGQRKDWTLLEGPVSPPISVMLSNDMLQLVDAPGLTLATDGATIQSPLLFATQVVAASSQASGENVAPNFTRLLEQNDITPNGDGRFVINTPGVYQVVASAAFAIANLAQPGARVVYSTFEINGVLSTGQVASVPGDGSTIASVQSVGLRRLPAGAIVGMACRQNSGADLDRLGNPNGSRTSLTIALVQP